MGPKMIAVQKWLLVLITTTAIVIFVPMSFIITNDPWDLFSFLIPIVIMKFASPVLVVVAVLNFVSRKYILSSVLSLLILSLNPFYGYFYTFVVSTFGDPAMKILPFILVFFSLAFYFSFFKEDKKVSIV